MTSFQSSITLQLVIDTVDAVVVCPKKGKLAQDSPELKQLLLAPIYGMSALDNASGQHISFLANNKYVSTLKNTQAFAVLVNETNIKNCPVISLVVDDPYVAFAKVSHLFSYQPKLTLKPSAKYPHACVDETAEIGKNVHIGHGVVIGAHVHIADNVFIGANTVIEDHVQVGKNTHLAALVKIGHHVGIGSNVRVHSNTTIGAEGFGFAPNHSKQTFAWDRIVQLGTVSIGDDVRIGSNTCIDRGALGDTIIETGVIIDNLVQIAHNVKIGAHTAIAACVGISGSTKVGQYCVIAGGVGIAGHLTIADHVQLTGMTIVTGSILQSGSYSSGTSTMPTKDWRRAAVNFKKLAKSPLKVLTKEINDLKVRLNNVESRF